MKQKQRFSGSQQLIPNQWQQFWCQCVLCSAHTIHWGILILLLLILLFVLDVEDLQLGKKLCHSIKNLGFYNCPDESLTFLPDFISHLKICCGAYDLYQQWPETLSAMSLFFLWILSNVSFKDVEESVSKAIS